VAEAAGIPTDLAPNIKRQMQIRQKRALLSDTRPR